jgi:hypothetical protein
MAKKKSSSSKKTTKKRSGKKRTTKKKSKSRSSSTKLKATATKTKKESTKKKPQLKDTFFAKIKNVLLNPTDFFKWLNEKTIGKAFLYFLGLMTLYTILDTIISFTAIKTVISTIFSELEMSIPKFWLTGGFFPVIVLVSIILAIIGVFIISGLLHIWILIFGGKDDFNKTFQVYTYSRTPLWLFGWIPFIWIFAWIYSLILLIIGTRELHGINNKRAIWMYLGPILVFFAIMIITAVLLFITIINISSASMI